MAQATKNKPKAKAKAKAKPAPKKAEATECCEMTQATVPQHGSIVHVEFTIPELQNAPKFYSELFGWQFFPHEEKTLYFQTPGNFGACGCVNQGEPSTDGKTVICVNVNDINATLDKAGKLGGKTVLPKTEIKGGHGFYATFRAPEGNVLGLYCRS